MRIAHKGQVVLGIDIGNVITGDTDKSVLFSNNYLRVPEIQDAFSSIALLYERFEGRVYLVSKCGGIVQVKTRHWLSERRFYDITGVPPDHVFFCEKREGKAPICAMLGVTDFIDDRLEVLGHLQSVARRFLFRPSVREVARNRAHLPHVIRVESWKELIGKM